MKTPLIIMTVSYAISFLAGVFGWYFDDGFYVLLGFAMLISLIWMWKSLLKAENTTN